MRTDRAVALKPSYVVGATLSLGDFSRVAAPDRISALRLRDDAARDPSPGASDP
jgi:hypothetical protein